MDITSFDTLTPVGDSLRISGGDGRVDDVRERFQTFLQAFQDTAEARVKDTLSENITEYGLAGWTARALESKAYEEARAKVLRDLGLSEEQVAALSEEEKDKIEIRVSSQLREELAQAVKNDAEEKLEAKRRALFHIVTLPTS